MQLITGILKDSIAQELNIEPGSKLLAVNGQKIRDIFDYQFLIEDEYLELTIEDPSGEVNVYPIEKDDDEELGLVFENSLMDQYQSCCNRCIFCFIDQMPPGMRPTLYFKDDDSRLSFLQGNYVTLTNMRRDDIERIIRYRMQPINISVHATDPDLRVRMLRNKRAGEVLEYLDLLYEAGITMNAQIVLCKGINDQEALARTIRDLSRYAPVMQSVSVVPVGLTRYREGLFPLEPLEQSDARDVVSLVESLQRTFFPRFDLHFVHASDELYLLAGQQIPVAESYDGYLQLENGVGMLRLLMDEFRQALKDRSMQQKSSLKTLQSSRGEQEGPVKRTIATGKLAEPLLRELVRECMETLGKDLVLQEHLPEIRVYAIENRYFGERITVSGLICGCDIIDQLKDQDLGGELLIPVNMMRAGERYFLDDVTVEDVEEALHVRVVIVPSSGNALLNAILGEADQETPEYRAYERDDRYE